MNPIARRALLRLMALVPLDAPPPGTVAAADLHTSLCDARAAAVIALGGRPDIDGYPLPDAPCQLGLFGGAA